MRIPVHFKLSLVIRMDSSSLNKETCLAVTAAVHAIPTNTLLKRGHLCLQKKLIQEFPFYHHLIPWEGKAHFKRQIYNSQWFCFKPLVPQRCGHKRAVKTIACEKPSCCPMSTQLLIYDWDHRRGAEKNALIHIPWSNPFSIRNEH